MNRTLVAVVIALLFIPMLPPNAQAQSVLGTNTVLQDTNEVHGLYGSQVILRNSTHMELFELTNNSVLDTKPCSGFLRMNGDADIIMCSNGIYSVSNSTLNLLHNGPINQNAQPSTNFTIEVNGNYYTNNPECIVSGNNYGYGSIKIFNGTSIHKSIQLSFQQINAYESISIKFAYIHENTQEITLIYDQNSNSYMCSANLNFKIFKFNYNTTSSLHFHRGGAGVWGTGFHGSSTLQQHGSGPINGAVGIYGGGSFKTIQLAPGAQFSQPSWTTPTFDILNLRPTCSIMAKEVGVSGDYVRLESTDYPIPSTPNSVSCNSPKNATMIVDGELVTLWNDEDNDGYNDLNDDFKFDSTQWSDIDNDGFGDNPAGVNPDSCPSVYGTSNLDMFGCLDNDGDGVSNSGDAFPRDSTQVNDTDQDGYGDSSTGNFSDSCPSQYGTSNRNNTLGCPDMDFDGWADSEDVFANQSSQWADSDGDGFGDELNGYQGDSCVGEPGSSYADKFGCPDSDLDGWSDAGDDLPYEPTQWLDADGDGYGNNQSEGASMIDLFPNDATQWNDSDGDGYGDNRYGSEGDKFPNDPLRWEDTDNDGVTDLEDQFPNDITQWNDTDGDGFGDEITGNSGDACPTIEGNSTADRRGCLDSDGDGWSDERDDFPFDRNLYLDTDDDGVPDDLDMFPFDPTQTEDRDGDGMGDNPMGIGADKFPDDTTQWGDIDGDGYGDNAEGTNPDAFITDATQWSDTDGDGYGDNPAGRLYDKFPLNPTQWLDEDGDGLGDNQSGTNADPSLNDFDNDGYNDSIDPLPKLASPDDLDNDGVLDVNDLFPEDFREWADYDGDGEGDNADTDDDNDGWADTDEVRLGTDPFGAADVPIDSFEIVIPGTAVGLGAWDLIGMFGGIPLFMWIGFGFVTRNGRTAKYEGLLREAQSRDELEDVARMWEYSLMLRMLGPHQGIRLERLRAELDDVFEAQNQTLSSIEPEQHDQTQMVEQAMHIEQKSLPSLESTQPEITAQGNPDGKGYEWYTDGQDTSWYRNEGSNSEWQRFEA